MREKHALVYDRTVRERGNVEGFRVRYPEGADGMARSLADDVELSFEGVAVDHPAAGTDENLPDDRHRVACGLAERGIVHRHVPPAEKHLSLVHDRTLDLARARASGSRMSWKKHHPDTVGARLR